MGLDEKAGVGTLVASAVTVSTRPSAAHGEEPWFDRKRAKASFALLFHSNFHVADSLSNTRRNLCLRQAKVHMNLT